LRPFCLLTLIQPAAAQTPPRRVFVEATNLAGGVVTDLRPEEFDVREGGEKREVSSAKLGLRPMRLVLIVDNTEGIRQPIGQIRRALAGFLDTIDARHEMMLVTVAGTMNIRVRPTQERKQLQDAVANLFGMGGTNIMHRAIDEAFHRFGQTTDYRPIFVVVTTEGFESTQQINPQEIKHAADHFRTRGGTLHAVRLIVPTTKMLPPMSGATELPVSLMIARDTEGAYTNISPNGLQEVLQRLAALINQAHENTPQNYDVEYSSEAKARKPAAPEVRVLREGIRVNVIAAP
jgi:Mg-chelatase subunit ChlD